MFMHSDDVDVRYAAFDDLGRTDKSEAAFDVNSLSSVSADSNVKGRYSFHFHKTGTADADNPAIALGNTVSGSPGWGFVHHSSNADFIENIAFDVFGAAFAAEDGDETGIWLRNMAIRAEGFDWGEASAKLQEDVARHDNGRTGDGFFFAGRLVEAAENIAINTTHGYVWMQRSAPVDALSSNLDHPEVAHGQTLIDPHRTPIQGFRDNEAFGTQVGLIVIKAGPEQGHDVRTVMEGFLNWETSQGVDLSYTSRYTLIDFDLLGTRNTAPVASPGTGVVLGNNTFDMVFNDLDIQGFATGANVGSQFTFAMPSRDVGIVLIDVSMTGVGRSYIGFDPARHTVMSSSDLDMGRLQFVQTPAVIRENQDLVFNGIKYDSIGQTNRVTAGDPQTIYRWDIPTLLRDTGYYSTADGQRIVLIPDYAVDRATGEVFKFNYVARLEVSNTALTNWGVQNNGLHTASSPAIAGNDRATTQEGQDVRIDVLANDRDPEGRALEVSGFTDPGNGDVFQQDDGTLLYRPNHGFSGTDSFHYWAMDASGNYTRATVTVEVWDL